MMGSARLKDSANPAGDVASERRPDQGWRVVSVGALMLAAILLTKSALIGGDVWAGVKAPDLRGFHAQASMGILAFHIFTASTALLIAVLQLSAPIRRAHPKLHRLLGRAYVVLVLMTAGASLGLSVPLNVFGTAFLRVLAAALWPAVTLAGVVAARRGDLAAHRRWMLRSFGFASMGMTFMLCTWIGNGLRIPFEYKYPAAVWVSMLGNLLIAELVAQRSARMDGALKTLRSSQNLAPQAL